VAEVEVPRSIDNPATVIAQSEGRDHSGSREVTMPLTIYVIYLYIMQDEPARK